MKDMSEGKKKRIKPNKNKIFCTFLSHPKLFELQVGRGSEVVTDFDMVSDECSCLIFSS